MEKWCIPGIILIFTVVTCCLYYFPKSKETKNHLQGTILEKQNDKIILQDKNNVIYTIAVKNSDFNSRDFEIGDTLMLEYSGIINSDHKLLWDSVKNFTALEDQVNEDGIPSDWADGGIFEDYYLLAYQKLSQLSLDEKIGQLLLVRYPEGNISDMIHSTHVGGFVFFKKDFDDKTTSEVQKMINNAQSISKIPLLTAVDEEGGDVVRVSSNPLLAKTPFLSPRTLYQQGGMEGIKKDTIDKSNLLHKLGLNVNLAPVVDIATVESDYMYSRSLGESTEITSQFAQTVIESSKGTGVSYTLKHFPGYGNNSDTHDGSAVDSRSLEEITKNDLPPFESGIKAKAEAVLVSHNIVENIDPDEPASLSYQVHNLLRDNLRFTGIIMTDDLDMGATSSIDNRAVKAILAGNDIIITTDYEKSIREIKDAINEGTISKTLIDKLAFRVLAWKYYKGIMFIDQK